MPSTITLKKWNNCLSQRFSLNESCNEDNMKSLSLWKSYLNDVFNLLILNKSAIVYISTTAEENFHLELDGVKIWIEECLKNNKKMKYFMAFSQAWRENDLEFLTSLMQFEMGLLWFQLVEEENSKINPSEFFHTTYQFVTKQPNDVILNDQIQCIGVGNDGYDFIWINPNWRNADSLLPHFQEMCLMLDFQWEIIDTQN